ncbi:transcription initiation factor TFIID subunit 1 [Salvelinus fontinalis]|uniref:transcription initiation factor TFIID subunit 1 n=1 Tax=Salvelinus fontinalis TaxID=8038 RepID=UPI002486BF49|nr:transcription initiation factor TFIID subunit 1 [Salvelinus fontinalis]
MIRHDLDMTEVVNRKRPKSVLDVRFLNHQEDIILQHKLTLLDMRHRYTLRVLCQDRNSLMMEHRKLLLLKVCEPCATINKTMKEISKTKKARMDRAVSASDNRRLYSSKSLSIDRGKLVSCWQTSNSNVIVEKPRMVGVEARGTSMLSLRRSQSAQPKTVHSANHRETETGHSANHRETQAREGHSANHRETQAGEGHSANHRETQARAGHSAKHRETEAGHSAKHRETQARAGHSAKHRETEAGHSAKHRETQARAGHSAKHRETEAGHSAKHRETEAGHSVKHRETEAREGHSAKHRETEAREGHSVKHRETEAGHSAKHRETEAGHSVKHRETEAGHSAKHRETEAGHSAKHRETEAGVFSIMQLRQISTIDSISEKELASQQQHARGEKERLKQCQQDTLSQKINNFLKKLDNTCNEQIET